MSHARGGSHYLVDATRLVAIIEQRGGPSAAGIDWRTEHGLRKAYYRARSTGVLSYGTAEKLCDAIGLSPWEVIDGWEDALPEYADGELTCPGCDRVLDRTFFPPSAKPGSRCLECHARSMKPCEEHDWRLRENKFCRLGRLYWRCRVCLHCQPIELEDAA